MSATRAQVVQEARTWLGTPYMHQQRMKGVGVDCVGLLVGIGRNLGLVAAAFDLKGYSRQPDGESLMATATELLVPIELSAMQPGDVVVMRFEQDPCHLAVLADYRAPGALSIIHALTTRAGGGRVVEHRLDATNLQKVVGAYQLPGVV